MNKYQILLFYKYFEVKNPEQLKDEQIALCNELNLKCRSIISKEGINVTLEGLVEDTEEYIRRMQEKEEFKDIHFKRSEGTGNAFPKISVKVRDEIVSAHLGKEDVNPNFTTGKYITAKELHELYHSDEEFYIVDMRNDYEHKVGFFEGSILMPLNNFRDLPKALQSIEHLKDKKVVTVCTGGVRCEKASGFLVTHGFKNVYQLFGGIHTYMEEYPNEKFKGKLYVFDRRVVMGFNIDDPKHEVVGKCDLCGSKSDNYIDCAYIHCKGHRHILCCENCLDENGLGFCCEECREKFYEEKKVEISN